MSDQPTDRDTAELVEVMARHFDGATVDGDDIALGFGDLHLRCRVNEVREIAPELTAVSLFFSLYGGDTGSPIFLSCSGYERDARTAIITGACHWACTFGAVLREGFGGELSMEPDRDQPERTDVTIEGRTFDVTLNGLSRSLSSEPGKVDMQALSRNLGASPFLMPRLFESGVLPALDPEAPSVISLFVSEGPESRITEVKVNGSDWPMARHLFDSIPSSTAPGIALFRELAVLRPRPAPLPLTRAQVTRTLRGIAEPLYGEARAMARWPGWTRHGGQLAPPMSERDLAALEDEIGPLPADYRHFLGHVAESGAGPGYGLVTPRGPRQAALTRGLFALVHETVSSASPSGVLALAHGGCASVWLLVLEGPHRGEVWVDAAGSDGVARRVAPSFEAWYRRWLEAGVRDRQCWTDWDGGACAIPSMFSKRLEQRAAEHQDLEPSAYFAAHPIQHVAIYAGETPYFDPRTTIDACQSCAMVAYGLGVDPHGFVRGPEMFGVGLTAMPEDVRAEVQAMDASANPGTGDAPTPEPPRAPFWKRWLGLG